MNKVFAIARAEYSQAVRSKAFIIGLFVMPILMGGGLFFQIMLKDKVDLRERKCAIVDQTGKLWPALEAAATQRNAQGIWKPGDDGERKQLRPKFVLERFQAGPDERADVLLSERVRNGELQGYVILEKSLLTPDVGERALAYHTDEPSFDELPKWVSAVVNDIVKKRRFQGAGMDQALAEQLVKRVPMSTWGLAELRADGSVDEGEKENKLVTFGVPFAGMMLLFMLVMTTAPQLMNQVLEEKMQRISEVLVSSVTPFQLMMGKLLGSVGVSMTLAAVLPRRDHLGHFPLGCQSLRLPRGPTWCSCS